MASRSSAARAAADRSFEELYRGHRADVFRAALRELGNVHDAEDVTQAAFVDAYRAVLRGSRPQSPRAWLLAIAENVRRRRFRTAARRPREEPTDADFPLTAELPHELAAALSAALEELPAAERRAFALRELAGRSYEEIAAETGTTVGAVQMQLFRARQTLRERLEPPQVRRRTGLLVPIPGWLTTLVSRVDVAVLTPRAAGAVGATVLAVAGTTVAVNEVEAGAPAAPVVDPRPAAVAGSRPAATRAPAAATAPAASPVEAVAAKTVSSPHPRAATPAGRPEPGTADPPTAAQAPSAPAPAPAPAARTSVATTTTTATRAAPAAPVVSAATATVETVVKTATPVTAAVGGTVDATVAQVEETLELPVLELPVPRPLPSPGLEAAAGAAGAAGDGALPLPLPGVPTVAVPPSP